MLLEGSTFLSPYSVLSSLYLTHLVLTAFLQEQYYYLHFKDEKLKLRNIRWLARATQLITVEKGLKPRPASPKTYLFQVRRSITLLAKKKINLYYLFYFVFIIS